LRQSLIRAKPHVGLCFIKACERVFGALNPVVAAPEPPPYKSRRRDAGFKHLKLFKMAAGFSKDYICARS
jgi:hypothetical protein